MGSYQAAEQSTLARFSQTAPTVMAGLDPAIYRRAGGGTDGPVKPGHDGGRRPMPYVNRLEG